MMLGTSFVVPDQPPVPQQPPQTAFNHPPTRYDPKYVQFSALDDLQGDTGHRVDPPGQRCTVVPGIGPDQPQPGTDVQQRDDQQFGAHPIANIRGGHHHREHESVHIDRDMPGLLLCVLVSAASVQDRDGARPLLNLLAASFSRVRLVWTDGGYAGKLVDWAKTTTNIVVRTVKRPDGASGFVVLPRRWVVERTLAWITNHQRCVRDYERLPPASRGHGPLEHGPRDQSTPHQIGSGTASRSALTPEEVVQRTSDNAWPNQDPDTHCLIVASEAIGLAVVKYRNSGVLSSRR